MSSYLSIYVVPKRKSPEESKQHIILASYSRCTEMYQQFYNNINPVYVGNGEDKYTTIGKNEISEVLDSFDGKIRRMTATLTEYEKYAKDNPDYIQSIIEYKEEIAELQYWRNKASFIEDMISDADYYDCDSSIEEVCCNID